MKSRSTATVGGVVAVACGALAVAPLAGAVPATVEATIEDGGTERIRAEMDIDLTPGAGDFVTGRGVGILDGGRFEGSITANVVFERSGRLSAQVLVTGDFVFGPRAGQSIGASSIQPIVFPQRDVDLENANAPERIPGGVRRRDHYKCYRVLGPRVGRQVALRDQFGALRTRTVRPVEVCNPVRKRHDGRTTEISNTGRHLVAYRIRTSRRASRALSLRNQFGNQGLNANAPVRLLVPARKSVVTGREIDLTAARGGSALDHYLCYSARTVGPRPSGSLRLVDQFERRTHALRRMRETCNPASTTFRGTTTRARQQRVHLASYQLSRTDSPPRTVRVTTQLGSHTLATRRATRLLVPSGKGHCRFFEAAVDLPARDVGGEQVGRVTKLKLTPRGGDPNGSCAGR